MKKLMLMVALVVFLGCMPSQNEAFAASIAGGEALNVLTVEDVFTITNRGVVVVGKISDGSLSVGDKVEILRQDGSKSPAVVGAIEKFRKMQQTANKGDNVGILLKDLSKSDVGPGDIIRR